MVPLQGTMFAILAFFIASAAYGSFRARSREAAVLLIAAIIAMMGPCSSENISFRFRVKSINGLNVLNDVRPPGYFDGVSLGAVALSLKIIFGVERS